MGQDPGDSEEEVNTALEHRVQHTEAGSRPGVLRIDSSSEDDAAGSLCEARLEAAPPVEWETPRLVGQ